MNAIYIDCRMGISGVKLLGGLVDLLDKPEQFLRRFNELGFRGMSIDREAEAMNGVTGSRIYFKRENDNPEYNEYGFELMQKKSKEPTRSGSHFRKLEEVRNIIDDLPLSGNIRKQAIKVYEIIAEEKARIRQRGIDEVHLHRTGTRDVIAAVVGVFMLLEELNCEKIIVSKVATGSGYADTSRGKLPIPVPVIENLLRGMPTIAGTEEEEMCTVEGAAILRVIADEFSEMPEMTEMRSGAGFGRDLKSKNINCLKVHTGTLALSASDATAVELSAVLSGECTELLRSLDERLESLGIRGAYIYPAVSLRGEQIYILKCVCGKDSASEAASEIMKLTGVTEVVRRVASVYEL